ncbi:PAS/PAC sensor hybrid histidine kinase [Candidatus Magnetomorum sp. HK-1]|nr:PAS/PAC sensor hybrid histidine kinase [Candidatus Magnetomorum sp. HK-1]
MSKLYSFKKAKILAVDDEKDLLDLIKMVLKDSLYDIHTANSGKEALEKLQNETYAVFILDIRMPEISGHDLAHKIKKMPQYKDTPIVFITGYLSEVDDIFENHTFGPVDYLMKPLDYHMLKSKVNFLSQLYYQKLGLEELNNKRLQEIERRKSIERDLEKIVRKQTNELRQSRESFKNVVEKSMDAILVINMDGCVMFMNKAAENILGQNKSKFIGTYFGVPIVENKTIEIDIISKKGKSGTGEMAVIRNQWEGRPAYLLTIRDITERKNVQEALQRSTEELQKRTNALEKEIDERIQAEKKIRELNQELEYQVAQLKSSRVC